MGTESGPSTCEAASRRMLSKCEQELENVSELQEAPTYNYISGKLDTLTSLYKLTYDIAFAKGAKNEA